MITNTEATGNARMSVTGCAEPGILTGTSISLASPMVPSIVAIPPIVFMTPLASDLRSPGTISGMRATTGPLTDCLHRLKQKTSAISSTREERAENGMSAKSSAESGSSVTMNGILLPMRVDTLSLSAEESGMRKIARMLSNVMIRPMRPALSMNFPRKIGIYVS